MAVGPAAALRRVCAACADCCLQVQRRRLSIEQVHTRVATDFDARSDAAHVPSASLASPVAAGVLQSVRRHCKAPQMDALHLPHSAKLAIVRAAMCDTEVQQSSKRGRIDSGIDPLHAILVGVADAAVGLSHLLLHVHGVRTETTTTRQYTDNSSASHSSSEHCKRAIPLLFSNSIEASRVGRM